MTAATSLVVLMLDAPLIGVGPRRRVLHAIPMKNMADAHETGHAVAVCGSRGLKLMQTAAGMAAAWPPACPLPARMFRCEDCWHAMPRRPRSRFAPGPADAP